MSNELLIACAVKGTFILIAAGLLSMALRRASAAARHLVWAVAFAALLLLPALSLAVPRWTVTAPQSAVRLAAPAQAVTVSKAVPAGVDWLVLIWGIGATLALARLAAGVAASGYATDLLEIARARLDTALPAPAMARASNLETRLRAILDPNIRRRTVRTRVAGAVAAAALLVLAPLAALRLHGQAAGTLAGTIYDASGARVPSATVSIVNTDTNQSQTAVSNELGKYEFANLPAGRYQVVVSSPGFAVYFR